ncbi:putative zinc-binding peptidase [Rhizobium sp. TH2]|uniref:zinc-binding metallopeptidase family protein n=1 Tax=Rhizobium sp. TH2 TaxID=2775403 RepID=UPI0021588236|nr:putative zinc-binding peptidase [Rhizobium sp. TH2]UVC09764.1 putative zinc-binding peptidase [Rhizobium sp. TH2]
MKLFKCQNCGNTIHFNNDVCLACNSRIGYLHRLFDMSALALTDDGDWTALADPSRPYIFCENAAEGACNWLVPVERDDAFCLACRFNLTIPDLSIAENHDNWRKIEQAKKHLFYSLTRWQLPMPRRADDPERGLAFEFLADQADGNGVIEPILTGHNDGLIAINIAEADDAERERRRTMMGEPYRTLIGHFRHEVGHFYWDLLVKDRGGIGAFSEAFGDPDIDYQLALRNHYANGAPVGWQQTFISAYASSHPWEDFAETWAHCFHMVDGLETARVYGIYPGETPAGGIHPTDVDPYEATGIDQIIAAWIPLTVAINSINRSLGQPDLYPFVLTDAIVRKIDFVFRLIANSRERP